MSLLLRLCYIQLVSRSWPTSLDHITDLSPVGKEEEKKTHRTGHLGKENTGGDPVEETNQPSPVVPLSGKDSTLATEPLLPPTEAASPATDDIATDNVLLVSTSRPSVVSSEGSTSSDSLSTRPTHPSTTHAATNDIMADSKATSSMVVEGLTHPTMGHDQHVPTSAPSSTLSLVIQGSTDGHAQTTTLPSEATLETSGLPETDSTVETVTSMQEVSGTSVITERGDNSTGLSDQDFVNELDAIVSEIGDQWNVTVSSAPSLPSGQSHPATAATVTEATVTSAADNEAVATSADPTTGEAKPYPRPEGVVVDEYSAADKDEQKLEETPVHPVSMGVRVSTATVQAILPTTSAPKVRANHETNEISL